MAIAGGMTTAYRYTPQGDTVRVEKTTYPSNECARPHDAAPCRNQCAGGHECVCLRGHQAPCICRNPACQCHTAKNYRLVMITQRGRAVYVPQDAAWAVMGVEP